MEFPLFQFVPTASYPSLDTSEKGPVLSSLHPPVFIDMDKIPPKPSLLEDNILINISKTLIKYVNIYVYLESLQEYMPWFIHGFHTDFNFQDIF